MCLLWHDLVYIYDVYWQTIMHDPQNDANNDTKPTYLNIQTVLHVHT